MIVKVREKKLTVNELRGLELLKMKKALGLSPKDVLKPEQVVKYARNKRKYPALYTRFKWDDTEAAHQYRLVQARNLFKEVRFMIPPGSGKKTFPDVVFKSVSNFVSLKSDQREPGGGYRETIAVLSDEDLREELLDQALDEIERWHTTYKALKELAPILESIDKVLSRRKRKRRR